MTPRTTSPEISDLSPEELREKLVAAMPDANIPTLLLLLVQLTGDDSWLEAPYQPERSRGIDDNDTGGLPEDVQDRVRSAAVDAIMAWHAGRDEAIPEPSPDQIIEMLSVTEAEQLPPEYAGIMLARLEAFADPEAGIPELEAPEGFFALIVGAGMSGICAAIRLRQAGIPYVIVEKQNDVAGVWNSHRYPGCSVDTPSHLYSYTFAGHDWSRLFPAREEIGDYFVGVAKKFGVYDEITFNTEVTDARFDEENDVWSVTLRRADGSTKELTPNILLTAAGQFAKPFTPRIEGIDSFTGEVIHTAEWTDELDVEGKRVAVIGTGASAMQFVPAVVDDVSEMTVFQRSRQWVAPFPKFKLPVPDGIRFLMKAVPMYQYWYRLRLSWIFDSKIHPSLQVDPEWPDQENSVNAINAGHRRFFTRYILQELGDRQDLADKVVPEYPPYGKRMLLDNGWFKAITRDHVELIDNSEDGIASVRGNTIITRQGREIEVDMIVFATGYTVANMLSTLSITGRGGKTIRDAWGDDNPQAYLGTTVPDFPNLFVLYGPNTQLGHGGAFIFIMECQVGYVIDLVRQMFDQGISSVEVKPEVHHAYNEEIQALHRKMIWTHKGMTTYVRNSTGRVVVNNPWRLVDFWRILRRANIDDYSVTEPAVAAAGAR